MKGSPLTEGGVVIRAPVELIMLPWILQLEVGFDSKCDNGTLWDPKKISQ